MARALTLADLLAQRRVLSPGELIPLFSSVLEDLEKAHSQGHLHGDVKPKKIVQVEERVWRLIDYGVSKIGTARYISPEKAQKLPVDARADLYSLGVVLYEAATGRPPFDAELGAELIQAHISQPPPPPSTVKPDLPPDLEKIILRALEKDPTRRFQSAREFRNALNALMPKETERPAPPSPASASETAGPVKTKLAPQSPSASQPERTPSPKPMAPPRPSPAQIQSVHPVHKEKGKIPMPVIPVILVIVASAALFFILSSRGKISVPEVVGQTQTEASANLESAGLRFALGPDKDGPLPMGLVAEQNPKPGSRVRKGTVVQIRLSTGMIEIPSLTGLNRTDAEKLLRAAGLDSIIIANEYSDEVETGWVVNVEPKSGTKVRAKTPVRLRIAAGRATCPQCGARREPGAQFCTRCGYRFPE